MWFDRNKLLLINKRNKENKKYQLEINGEKFFLNEEEYSIAIGNMKGKTFVYSWRVCINWL